MQYKKYNNAKTLVKRRKINKEYILSFPVYAEPLTYCSDDGTEKALTRQTQIILNT